MVDVSTYWTLHGDSTYKTSNSAGSVKLPIEAMERDEPPDGDFINLLPPTIIAYNMVEKKWCKCEKQIPQVKT